MAESCSIDELLRRDAKNLRNRLASVKLDSQFVGAVALQLAPLNVVPNERCGLWYVEPKLRSHGHSVYFKSTDGHFGKWDLSTKRLNLHILKLIARDGGCIIVDSTRSGKRFPDSLSKTIPIWCCVINNAIATHRATRSELSWDTAFHSLPTIVPQTEHEQIASHMPALTRKLVDSAAVDVVALSQMLQKPLRPIWIAPDTRYFVNRIDDPHFKRAKYDFLTGLEYYPVFCVNASEVVADGTGRRCLEKITGEFGYVQGAGDDHELWGEGLTPDLFWAHENQILAANRTNADCVKVVREIVQNATMRRDFRAPSTTAAPIFNWVGETGIAIGGRRSGKPPECWDTFDIIINCGALEYPTMLSSLPSKSEYLYLAIPEGKRGQHALYTAIPVVIGFLQKTTCKFNDRVPKVLVHCLQGKGRSVAIAICLLVLFQQQDGTVDYARTRNRGTITKKRIQDILINIQQYRHVALPSRAFMCRINDYFLSPREKS
ncbi:tRNA A64-2'-O-ribosylphosphate transferase [Chytriomyces sp. MP71]|nr:tRNA A64-2'-O-ribosylphosphate transferase [Chytriomyces sp. MP71]